MMDLRLIFHTFLGLLLMLIPAGALYMVEKQMLGKLGIAVARMLAQLLALCLVVWLLIKVDSVWLTMAWLLVMSFVSGLLVIARCKLSYRLYLPSVSVGLLCGVLFVGLWLLVFVLPVRAFSVRWFVPVMALLLGHSTSMMIRGLSTFVSALENDRAQYEFLQGNGLSRLKALQPFIRRALLAIVSPTITNLSILGLASMPLLLCGLFLGGFTPINAFFLMFLLVIGCVSASVLSLSITLLIRVY